MKAVITNIFSFGKEMTINITIDGQVCAGGLEIGKKLSSHVDRPNYSMVMLRRLARKLGTDVHGVVRKERSFSSLKVRFINRLEVMMSGGHYYGFHSDSGMAWHIPYPQKLNKKLPGEISDTEYIDAFYSIGKKQTKSSGAIIVKRGGCLNMKSSSNVFHIGIFAPREKRIIKMVQRLNVGIGEAEALLEKFDTQRREWFRKISDAEPEDQALYDLVINSDNTFSEKKNIQQILEVLPV